MYRTSRYGSRIRTEDMSGTVPPGAWRLPDPEDAMPENAAGTAGTPAISGWIYESRPQSGREIASALFNRPGGLGDIQNELTASNANRHGNIRVRDGRIMFWSRPDNSRKVTARLRYANGKISWASRHVTKDLLERAAVLSIRISESAAGSADYDILVIYPKNPKTNALQLAGTHIVRSGTGDNGREMTGFKVWTEHYPPKRHDDYDDGDLPF